MNKRFESLDAFRGLCALFVVIFHMRFIGSITELDFFRGSYIFVEFFFVLSGFVLAHGYGFKDNLTFKRFIKARFFRLYPLHFFMFLVFLLLEFGKLAAYKLGGFVFNTEPFTHSTAIGEIIPNLLLIQAWTPFTDAFSFNFPSWSISIEFYLYILLFLTISISGHLKKACWFLISIITLLLIGNGSELLMPAVFSGLSCFFGGAFTYVIYQKISRLKLSKMMGSLLELVLLLLIIWIVQTTFEYKAIITTFLFYLVVLVFSFESGIFSHVLKFNIFQIAGKLSYSIYMTHAAILFCITSFMMIVGKISGVPLTPMINGERFITSGSLIINNIFTFLILAIVVYISHLTYKYIELKGQALGKRY